MKASVNDLDFSAEKIGAVIFSGKDDVRQLRSPILDDDGLNFICDGSAMFRDRSYIYIDGEPLENLDRRVAGDSIVKILFTEEEFKKVNDISSKESFLRPQQRGAISKMTTGCILNGGTGSGKSRTGLTYYFEEQGGKIEPTFVKPKNPKDLYIITTAMKRDQQEWENELVPFCMSSIKNALYSNKVVVDSWNNIKKYVDAENAFFIFDEDRIQGNGAWVQAFYKIAKKNDWIVLSATPGDTWKDYIPIFVANGFYKNRTDFNQQHVIWKRCGNHWDIDRYMNTGRLIRLRNRILIDMDVERHTVKHHEDIYCTYDHDLYRSTIKERKDPYKKEYVPCKEEDPDSELVDGKCMKLVNPPIPQASVLCQILQHIVGEDESRQAAVLELTETHPRVIIFYNYNYERDILMNLGYAEGTEIAEWSGHAHQPLPTGDRWVYLVQYTAGCEGWNCITTDTIIFYSQNYSYKVVAQAEGRIDRLNTPFTDLYYYHLKSRSGIDIAISKALDQKKKFNENKWAVW